MLKTKKVMAEKQVPVTVTQIKRYGPLTASKLHKLPCTLCQKPMGNRDWGIAWIIDDGHKRSARLCADCTDQAEKELESWPSCRYEF